MATNSNLPSELSTNTRAIRLYADDDEKLISLHAIIKKLNRKIDIVDLIRDCIQEGLPAIEKRWEPMMKDKK